MATQYEFLKTVAQHEIQVLRDDGLYRHIRFRRPNTMVYHFDLITWPGHLCYTGDMGSFTFRRLEDMFEFFRADARYQDFEGLSINPSYWSEKLVSVSGGRYGGKAMEFDDDTFRRIIKDIRRGMIQEAKVYNYLDKDQRRDLWEAIDDEVLRLIDDGQGERAIYAAYDFRWQSGIGYAREGYGVSGRKTWQFDDLFDYNFNRYTYGYLWCCYALAWGVQKYDEFRAKQEQTL